jgi:hypothetical protein
MKRRRRLRVHYRRLRRTVGRRCIRARSEGRQLVFRHLRGHGTRSCRTRRRRPRNDTRALGGRRRRCRRIAGHLLRQQTFGAKSCDQLCGHSAHLRGCAVRVVRPIGRRNCIHVFVACAHTRRIIPDAGDMAAFRTLQSQLSLGPRSYHRRPACAWWRLCRVFASSLGFLDSTGMARWEPAERARSGRRVLVRIVQLNT